MANNYEEDNNAIWQLLHQARRMLHRGRQKELLPLGITSPQSAVLSILNDLGRKGTIPSEIARQLFREPHTVIGTLAIMEKHGQIKMAKDLERKNLVRVTITPKGRDIYKKSLKTDFIPYVMSDFSQEDRRLFKLYLKTLRDKSAVWLRRNQKTDWID